MDGNKNVIIVIGFTEESQNVRIAYDADKYKAISGKKVEAMLKSKNQVYEDVLEVPNNEVQYYGIDDTCFLSDDAAHRLEYLHLVEEGV